MRRVLPASLLLVAVTGAPAAAQVELPPDPVCTIVGTDGDDVLRGTPGDDVICGVAGDDTIWAGDGNDVILGGDGGDRIGAGPGDDVIDAGDGADVVWGDHGDDDIVGGLGADQLWGGDGDDEIEAGPVGFPDYEQNIMGAGAGDREVIHGSEGPDVLYGGTAEALPDEHLHGPGTILHGGGGDDLIVGPVGTGSVYAGPAAGDNLVLAGRSGQLVILGGDTSGHNRIYGTPGDDIVLVGHGTFEIHVGAGDDLVGIDGGGELLATLGPGNDEFSSQQEGGRGTVYGGPGDDLLEARSWDGGSWRFVGDAGDDVLRGGIGDDILIGGTGADELFGDAGDDTIWSGADGDPDRVYGMDGDDRCDRHDGDTVDCESVTDR